MSTQIGLLFGKEQFRMYRLQVFNWGTFAGLHDIPISEKGFLFVGRSGAGKSTLLDAFSALLIPPRWIDFNAAAREADRSGRDRNFVSYIRGAWAEQKDGESGEIATRYLRTGTTWSALALSYRNECGQVIVLVQLFWLRGNANGSTDVNRHYFIFERTFDLSELEDFGQSNLDIRKLKQSFPEMLSYSEFRPYCERFCRLLGIESEMALRLLHKTQSAKNLGDLNTFLREFMLDKPETFEVADRLVNEFSELNAAHQAVVTAREQVQTLRPAKDKHDQLESLTKLLNDLRELQVGTDSYREAQRIALLKEHISSLAVKAEGLNGEMARRQSQLDNQKLVLQDLEQRHRDIGGVQLEQWEKEWQGLESIRAQCVRKRDQASNACSRLGWLLSDSPQEFAEIIGNARGEIEGWQNKRDAIRTEQIALTNQKMSIEEAFRGAVREISALEKQPSSIPADMLDLRSEIASKIGVSEMALPFVGELIEVKPDESIWLGAIERVLHGFALSILVDERHYAALSSHINSTYLGRRLVYYRTGSGRAESGLTRTASANSMVLKLNVKESSYADWLKGELRQRFDYECTDSVQAFRTAERALTSEGQVKHSKTRHEKDDRRAVSDRRNWVLGFDNRDKLALFREQAQELAAGISDFDAKIKFLSEQDKTHASRMIHCQTLVNLQWQEIDAASLIARISTIERLISETRDSNTQLTEIVGQIETQKAIVKQTDADLLETKVEHKNTRDKIDDSSAKLDVLLNNPSIIELTSHQKAGFDQRYAQHADIRLGNLDQIARSVDKNLNQEIQEIHQGIIECRNCIENIFGNFKRSWPMDAGDVDTTLASASDFFAKLTRLEADGLPAHEQRFFDLLQNQSHQNLAALSAYLNTARKAILERMELVNDSLNQVPFNQSSSQCTYLHIDASDRQLPEVREFKQEILQALSHAWSEDRESAEARFLVLRKLVERLSSLDPEQKRWRESVLDVRQHVEFIGREIDEGGVEVEIYRSGAGKSGGQRQKLATTCLAAALRYQLGGSDLGVPMYAPVILDEAFDKADNEFTALAMNIFNNFGFQMIVATPLKSVMTLEPFIGGACFVDIKERRVSGVLVIEYDSDRQRLNLPDNVHAVADSEVS